MSLVLVSFFCTVQIALWFVCVSGKPSFHYLPLVVSEWWPLCAVFRVGERATRAKHPTQPQESHAPECPSELECCLAVLKVNVEDIRMIGHAEEIEILPPVAKVIG